MFSLTEFIQERGYTVNGLKLSEACYISVYIFENVRLCNLPLVYLTALYQLLTLYNIGYKSGYE